MGLSMQERKAVTKQMAKRYQRSSKAEKGRMLDELCALTGWTRRHARRALVQAASPPVPAGKRGRPVIYGVEVIAPLRLIWATLDGPCGKRLAPFMKDIIEALEAANELRLDVRVRSQLLSISAATIDRLLAGERARLSVKGRTGTKPGSLLKAQIPIRTFADWDEARPGFLEADLVGHDGGDMRGIFCQTLTLTDVASGWTEVRALKNKAQRWVLENLSSIATELPFALLGIDSDNGGEFINQPLLDWCTANEITFTRTRPYRKNDNCFVEQKNWAVVRHAVGYMRYDTDRELDILGELYRHLRLYVNFFQPQMKLLVKSRDGAKVRRRYDLAKTPYQRLLASERIPPDAKLALTSTYRSLNPAQLKRDIARLQKRLIEVNRLKSHQPRKEVRTSPDHPWRTSISRQPAGSSRTS